MPRSKNKKCNILNWCGLNRLGKLVTVSVALLFIVMSMMNVVMPKYGRVEAHRRLHKKMSFQKCNEANGYNDEDNTGNYSDWKRIVIWTKYFGNSDLWESAFSRHCSRGCEESRCIFSTKKEDVANADAVIFKADCLDRRGYRKKEVRFKFPANRKKEQIYIFYSTEPPSRHSLIKFKKYKNFFNWTMTYRRDSDIYSPYGMVTKRNVKDSSLDIQYATDEDLKNKNLGIWLNSHCLEDSPRNKLVSKIEKFAKISKFGKCFAKKCGKQAVLEKASKDVHDGTCEKTFPNYAFFFALENSHCKDYVSEKLFRSLQLKIIPVVFGAVDYSQFAPPNSYIDTREFDSAEELAHYLERVASNATLYNSYLKWQEEYEVEVGLPYNAFVCGLCKKLHEKSETSKYKTYDDIKRWWFDQGRCYVPKEL